jgi:hypothetical protein
LCNEGAENARYICNIQVLAQSKQITHWAKISPIWSPWFCAAARCREISNIFWGTFDRMSPLVFVNSDGHFRLKRERFQLHSRPSVFLNIFAEKSGIKLSGFAHNTAM